MILALDFEVFLKLLNKFKVEYLVIGGYAVGFHGRPRYTQGLDVWINISQPNVEKLIIVLKNFGISPSKFSKEDFLQPGQIFQIGLPPLRIEILNSIDGVLFRKAFENKELMIDGGLSVFYIGLKDLVRNKMILSGKQNNLDVRILKRNLPNNSRNA